MLHNLSAPTLIAIGVVAQWLFSAIVSGMPSLPPTASYGAQWAYNAMHSLAANLDKLKLPTNGK